MGEGRFEFVSLSSDGTRAAVSGRTNENDVQQVFVFDESGGRPMQLTSSTQGSSTPVWSPDDQTIAFKRSEDIFAQSASGTGSESPLVVGDGINKFIYDWSDDGVLSMNSGNTTPGTAADLWIQRLEEQGDPTLFRQTEASEFGGRFSPNGRWIAYVLNDGGGNEVFVEPFPGPGAIWPVSSDGGTWPRWSDDGRELYYLGPDNRLVAVAVTTDASSFAVGEREVLFEVQSSGARAPYDVSPDGLHAKALFK